MFNPYALGFVVAAAAAVAGADYVVQSKANGSNPGEFSLSAYVGGYPGRVTATLDAIDKARRQSRPARSHLPEDPAGWQRQAWERDTSRDAEITAGMTLLEKRAFKDRMKAARKAADAQVFEYVRGEDRVRLSAVYDPEVGRTGRATAFVAPGVSVDRMYLTGYDIVDGVMFFRMAEPGTGQGTAPDGPLMLQAFIGDEVAIGVYADAPHADLPGLLAAIDYDGLNAMLDEPLQGIGSAAVPVTGAEKQAMLESAAADYMSDRRTAAARQGKDAQARAARVKLNGGTALERDGRESGTFTLSGGQGNASGTAPKRLQLSGGRACVGASSGKLCD